MVMPWFPECLTWPKLGCQFANKEGRISPRSCLSPHHFPQEIQFFLSRNIFCIPRMRDVDFIRFSVREKWFYFQCEEHLRSPKKVLQSQCGNHFRRRHSVRKQSPRFNYYFVDHWLCRFHFFVTRLIIWSQWSLFLKKILFRRYFGDLLPWTLIHLLSSSPHEFFSLRYCEFLNCSVLQSS